MSDSLGTLPYPRMAIADPSANPLQSYLDTVQQLHGFTDDHFAAANTGEVGQVAPPVPIVAPTPVAAGVSADAAAVADYIARQRADAVARGLWSDQAGLPTGAGVVQAARQYGEGLLQGSVAPGGQMHLPGLFEEAPKVAEAAVAPPVPEPPPAPPENVLQAYHGSPHQFAPVPDNPLGAFSLEKLGTGEGAQAFGHGVYLAENENTARQYRDALSQAPTFDFSGVGGPEGRFGVQQTKELLTDFVQDHPDLENADPGRVTDGVHWAVDQAGTGRPIEDLHKDLDTQQWPSDDFKAGGHAALEFLSDAKVDPGRPTVGGEPFDPLNLAHKAAWYVDRAGGDPHAGLAAIDDDLASVRAKQAIPPGDPYANPTARGYYRDAEQRLLTMRQIVQDGAVGQYKAPGHMYAAEIAGAPDEFLHWDRYPLEQSPKVQAALDQTGVLPGLSRYADLTRQMEDIASRPAAQHAAHPEWQDQWDALNAERGQLVGSYPRGALGLRGEGLYQSLAARLMPSEPEGAGGWSTFVGGPQGWSGHAKASAALSDAGIKGIRYLDAGSRGQGEGTHNFVIFNPANIRIIRRYGIGALVGGSAAAGVSGAQQ